MDNENNQPGAQAGTGAANDTSAAGAAAGAENNQRMFTQAELNQQIADRLQRERAKYADYAQVKQELADLKAENTARAVREQVAAEKKIPVALLNGNTKEACEQQADAILAFAGSRGYISVPNHGVDHLLGAKQGKGGSETDAALAQLRDGLFPAT